MNLSQTIPFSVAASSVTANILNGTNLQYIGAATNMTMWAATNSPAGAIVSFSLTGSVGAQFATYVPAGTTINLNAAGPQQLNDLVGSWAIRAGTNLVLALTADATVGTHVGAFRFQLEG